jgi:hypothetical protein
VFTSKLRLGGRASIRVAPSSGSVKTRNVAREPLERAVKLMAEHQLTDLLVVTGALPVGVVSTLDVAACPGWGEA